MESGGRVTRRARSTNILLLYLCFMSAVSSSFLLSAADARKSEHHLSRGFIKYSSMKVVVVNHVKHLDVSTSPVPDVIGDINEHDNNNNNVEPYEVSSPFSLPPFDSLAPIPLPEISNNTPPFCEYPPSTPNSPSPPVPSLPPSPIPVGQGGSGGGGGGGYTPQPFPSSPFGVTTNPTPPPPPPPPPSSSNYEPSPPIVGSPGSVSGYVPPPPPPAVPDYGFVPSPPVFQPPVVYPPPRVPPQSPNNGPSTGALWCVAKPSVPDPIIEEAMNYACGSGADCESLQPNQPCFQPNTLFAHASYAFNSYWQRTKAAGGTCEFGGTAILVTVNPSYDGCQFLYN